MLNVRVQLTQGPPASSVMGEAEVEGSTQAQVQSKLGPARVAAGRVIQPSCHHRPAALPGPPQSSEPVMEKRPSQEKHCQKVVTRNEAVNGVITA